MQRQRQDLEGVTVRLLRERVVGNKAYLDYRLSKGGAVLTVRGDLYVRVRGLWLDEADRYTTC
jgi:hypothetical protein